MEMYCLLIQYRPDSIIRVSGPEHAYFHETKRVNYVSATDEEALEGLKLLSLTEGIIPALESAHAVAYAAKLAPTMRKDEILIINLSGI